MIACKKTVFFLVLSLILWSNVALGQRRLNLDFEDTNNQSPTGWICSLSGFDARLDSIQKIHGKYSYSLSSNSRLTNGSVATCSMQLSWHTSATRIRLSGFLKTENVSEKGFAGFWLRVNGANGVVAFDNMQRSRVNGSNDWKEYSIELPLSDAPKRIIIGLLIVGGEGKVWADDLKLYLDEELVTEPPQTVNDAALKSSGLEIPVIDGQTIDNLASVCKIWGFLKYYSPEVAKQKINWDAELFKFLSRHIKSKSQIEKDKLLLNWIISFGVTKGKSLSTSIGDTVKLKPDLLWFKSLRNEKIRSALNYVLTHRNSGHNRYVGKVWGVGNPIFRNEEVYENLDFPDVGFRLLTLFRYWNCIQYFFPYRYAIGSDWNDALREFIPKFIKVQNKLEYHLLISELISYINDSHAAISENDTVIANFKGKYIAAIKPKWIQGKIVVANYYSHTFAINDSIEIGDIITAVDGVPVEHLLLHRLKYFSGSNQESKMRNFCKDLLRSNKRLMKIQIESNGITKERWIKTHRRDSLDTRIDWNFALPDSSCTIINGKIGYIYLGSIRKEELMRFSEKFQLFDGLIIDVRNYPSDFVANELCDLFSDVAKEFVKFSHCDINYPGTFLWSKALTIGGVSKALPYKRPIVVLVNELTQSMAEYTVMALQSCSGVKVIGSTTAGADGNISFVVLPGNIRTSFSGIGVYYPDGRETQRIGIVPDIKVIPTIESLRENRDDVLIKAVSLLMEEK